jgi:hypothetical protein
MPLASAADRKSKFILAASSTPEGSLQKAGKPCPDLIGRIVLEEMPAL